MRKLLRNMAKVKMGCSKVNKRMNGGRWRQIVGAYPVNIVTGKRMSKDFRGKKQYKSGYRHPFVY